MRPFDVQVLGGLVLHEGKIAEMKTGEGKTLAATMPLYLNALAGKGVHLVTVNDYLARRDADWMGPIYNFLGMTVGVIVHGMEDDDRRDAYHADITYGTNNEFGFDYLRDNMKFSLDDYVQRDFFYAIVDEVDSILIDEARTPLIISGASDESTDKYARVNQVIPNLRKEKDYTVDEKSRTVHPDGRRRGAGRRIISRFRISMNRKISISFIMSIRRCAPIPCSGGMWITSSRRGRSSSSMNSPAG